MSDANAKKKRATPRRPALSVRQVKFAEAYALTNNATEAFVTAGFTANSRGTAQVGGWRLLRNRAIADLIRSIREEAVAAARVSVDRIAAAMANIAFSDRRDLFDAQTGRLLPPHQWPPDIASAVESIELEDGVPVEVKTGRRMDALKVLAQWKRMIGRDSEVETMDRELQRLRALLEQVRGQNGQESQ
jgi:phage terminase small subunit